MFYTQCNEIISNSIDNGLFDIKCKKLNVKKKKNSGNVFLGDLQERDLDIFLTRHWIMGLSIKTY